MDIRSQIAMVFHLDKCIGCHTCSIACKNIWTDRKGAEYMWWNNVETKPGTGYPNQWEDQEIYKGGWVPHGDTLRLKGTPRFSTLANIFHNPNMPVMDDYYEPWTYDYANLFEAPPSDDQPTARPISLVTGKPMDIQTGPNWDDDLGGSPDYARKDPNLEGLSDAEKETMFQLERLTMFYLPRICNHCLNAACVAACPSGAIYKRGEDGVVLLNQNKCRSWRMCVSACPYKKSYYNWDSGKSEKCLLCYPRIESGQAPACMHTCVGRIRYLGVLLYDADRIREVASCPENELVDKQLALYVDPFDPDVCKAARENGIAESTLEAARQSPVWKFLKVWQVALPLHPEYRTLPNLFYVPPLLPAIGSTESGRYESTTGSLWGNIDQSRVPIQFMANLFTAGDQEKIRAVLKKLMAVRIHRRFITVGDIPASGVQQAFAETGLDEAAADAVYRLTSLPKFKDRFVIPAAHREEAPELLENTADIKGHTGFGFLDKTRRM